MKQDEIIEMARQADVWVAGQEPYQSQLEAFAKLVALRYEKKIADLENIIAQRHWNVLQEREACAKVCVDLAAEYISAGHPANEISAKAVAIGATRIRARGEA